MPNSPALAPLIRNFSFHRPNNQEILPKERLDGESSGVDQPTGTYSPLRQVSEENHDDSPNPGLSHQR